ncbi:cell envelope integrity protein CreD [Persicirhabdus sediminis]|uniref:Cell envelope integrity protein CreD n=1 Tax=Persicirhabdus sediminis TaxID=454144 RepID=A0A8J7MBN6_9BACT|nr:cell envelope integrity protein CreD [Persicirhabdus sediminis]
MEDPTAKPEDNGSGPQDAEPAKPEVPAKATPVAGTTPAVGDSAKVLPRIEKSAEPSIGESLKTGGSIVNKMYRGATMGSKIFLMGVMALVLLLPASMVKGLMEERETRRDHVVREINDKWGEEQTIAGPYLRIPYLKQKMDHRGQSNKQEGAIYVFPNQLDIAGQLDHEVRYRGIFEAVLYSAGLTMRGDFDLSKLADSGIDESFLLWEQAELVLELSDLKGVQAAEAVVFDGAESLLDSYSHARFAGKCQLASPVKLDAEKKDYAFALQLQLRGSDGLNVVPVGKNNQIKLSSSWDSPSFTGNFLPSQRELSDQGFSAQWNVSSLNRGFPQIWTDSTRNISQDAFGVRLMMPTATYQKSMRLVSYAFLFIVFTFAAMFCAELISKVSIHPLQYLMVGVSMVIFYLLLISLAEQIAFGGAYFIAAILISSMVVSYVSSIVRNRSMTIALAGMLAALYSYFYIILQCEDYALTMGSLGLLAIVGIVMRLTRGIHRTADLEPQSM